MSCFDGVDDGRLWYSPCNSSVRCSRARNGRHAIHSYRHCFIRRKARYRYQHPHPLRQFRSSGYPSNQLFLHFVRCRLSHLDEWICFGDARQSNHIRIHLPHLKRQRAERNKWKRYDNSLTVSISMTPCKLRGFAPREGLFTCNLLTNS